MSLQQFSGPEWQKIPLAGPYQEENGEQITVVHVADSLSANLEHHISRILENVRDFLTPQQAPLGYLCILLGDRSERIDSVSRRWAEEILLSRYDGRFEIVDPDEPAHQLLLDDCRSTGLMPEQIVDHIAVVLFCK